MIMQDFCKSLKEQVHHARPSTTQGALTSATTQLRPSIQRSPNPRADAESLYLRGLTLSSTPTAPKQAASPATAPQGAVGDSLVQRASLLVQSNGVSNSLERSVSGAMADVKPRGDVTPRGDRRTPRSGSAVASGGSPRSVPSSRLGIVPSGAASPMAGLDDGKKSTEVPKVT